METQRWYFRLCIFLATCFGVFVLPFLLPPPPLAGISAANVAGFNNKVASLAAAALGVFVFFAALRTPHPTERNPAGFGAIPARFILAATILCGCMVAGLCYVVAISGEPYGDSQYFMHQIMMHADYGRKLYDQIEFTYGPALFYGPIFLHKLLLPFHATTTGAYYGTLVLEHVTGLLLVVYVLDCLPILRRWKIVFLLLCLVQTYPFGFGLNYTFFRFVLPIS